MNDTHDEHRQKVALFRYGVIADLIHLKPGHRGLYALLEEKAAKDYDIPGTRRRHVAPETIRGWLKDYRKRGFDGLVPKKRKDVGDSHSIPKQVQDLLILLKEDNPDYSVSIVIDEARRTGSIDPGLALPPSTVHRLLARHGLMKKRKEEDEKDRRRFAFAHAGDFWMSDVMHGPAVVDAKKRKRKTYLIAFIDDATRVIPYATFASSEGNADFLPALQQAILRRGIPKRLFVDNGSAFRSHHLQMVMAKLGVTLIHARARHPQAKGKIERWFRTVRTRLLVRLQPEDLSSLDALNRRLWMWVESEYHHTPHRGLDQETPLDRWAQTGEQIRYAHDLDLDDLFLFEAQRKVKKDRTVSLDGIHYEVDAVLVDERVTLRFDPKNRKIIQVYFEDRRFSDARPVDVHANCFVKRDKPGVKYAGLSDDEEVR